VALCAVCGIQAGACTRNAQRERAGRARVGARIRGSPRQLHFSLAMELVPVRVLRVLRALRCWNPAGVGGSTQSTPGHLSAGPVPVQMWAAGEESRGADVGGVSPAALGLGSGRVQHVEIERNVRRVRRA
jgi:hypothetical protein